MSRSRLILYIAVFALLGFVFQPVPVQALGMAKLAIKVIDEEGHALDGAKVVIHFQGGGLDKDATRGKTDEDGIYRVSGLSRDGSTGGGVYKAGYYKSVFHHDFYRTSFGIWQPWGKELSVTMRPVVNPVPMYVRNTSLKAPINTNGVGFDLEKSDWVIPYGQGIHSDFIFKIERQYDNVDNFDAIMTLTFSNPFDGIQVIKDDGGGDFNTGSWFRLPRTAPVDGYRSQIKKRNTTGSYGYHLDMEDDNNYIFRVRSVVDENGKLQKAMYGKIRGDLWYTPGGGKISIHYYLNPDYTRNLEFDPKRNLSIINSSGENVTQP